MSWCTKNIKWASEIDFRNGGESHKENKLGSLAEADLAAHATWNRTKHQRIDMRTIFILYRRARRARAL